MRLAGIEPTTPWFVAKYSIQLSYSREASNYSSTTSREAAPVLLALKVVMGFSFWTIFCRMHSRPLRQGSAP